MARTAQLDLPLVMAAQAQKHVTVNEALARLDAVAQLRVISSALNVPPVGGLQDGASYLVPSGAEGDWQDKAGRIALWSNGGWIFLEPKAGWRAWDETGALVQMYDGTTWIPDAAVVSPNGAGILWQVVEVDHVIMPGATNLTTVAIPSQAQVLGITGRVVTALTGVTGWKIGVAGAGNRYGSGLGTARNSYLVGLSGAPVTYHADTPLLLAAEGGSFSGGLVRLALHFMRLSPPRAV